MINDFEFTQPRNVPEALEALAEKGRVMPVAGGTNVLVNMKRAPLEADLLVDLTRLEALEPISIDNGRIRLGGRRHVCPPARVAPGWRRRRSHGADVRRLRRPAHPQPCHRWREHLRCVCRRRRIAAAARARCLRRVGKRYGWVPHAAAAGVFPGCSQNRPARDRAGYGH